MNKDQVFSIIRHVLAAAGGIYIAKGLGTEGMVDQFIGAIMSVIAIVWSIKDKSFDVSMVEGTLRQVLTSAGAFIAFLSPTFVEQFVAGVATLLPIILGQIDKYKRSKAEEVKQ